MTDSRKALSGIEPLIRTEHSFELPLQRDELGAPPVSLIHAFDPIEAGVLLAVKLDAEHCARALVYRVTGSAQAYECH